MKKTRLIAVVLSLCMLLALIPVAALAVDFTDIADATNGSYVNAIERWSDEGVISGVGNDAFNPKGNMTRVQGFGIIANLLNLTEKADLSEYTDVPTATWKVDYLAKVVAAGIVTGYPNKALGPDDDLTREQMFVTIARTLGIQPVATDDEAFKDIGKAGDYAVPYINALHKIGAVNGYNGNVNPLATLSREGAALLLDNLIGGYANADGETATIVAGKITLIVADNAKVEGTANDLPIVIAGQAHIVDMRGVKGAAIVNVTVPGVEIRNAPAGTKVTVPEGVTGVRVNGRTVSDGQTITVEGTSGGGSSTGGGPIETSYEIVYSDGTNTFTDHSETNAAEVKSFTALTETQAKEHSLLTSVADNMKFVSWATVDGTAYEPGAKYDISGRLELTAQFIDTSDYIAMAVKGTMDKINTTVIKTIDPENKGISAKGSSVKIDRLAYNGTVHNNTRPQTVSGSVSASADLANYIVEYACTVAVNLIDSPSSTPSESEVQSIVETVVHSLEDALDIEIYREDSVRTIARKIYSGIKDKTDPAGTFRNSGDNKDQYCFSKMEVTINGKGATIKVENNQASLELNGRTRREVVGDVAFAVAKTLYEDLMDETAWTKQLTLSATVDVEFTKANTVTNDYPTSYPVTVKLTLDAGDLAEVKYDSTLDAVDGQNGAVVVKVNASEIESAYNEGVQGVIDSAITKMDGSIDGMLEDMVETGGALGQLTKAVAEFKVNNVQDESGAQEYVKSILSGWLDKNLAGNLTSNLANETPDNAAIVKLVKTLSSAASTQVNKKIDDAVAANQGITGFNNVIKAIVTGDFVPMMSEYPEGEYDINTLALIIEKQLEGSDFSFDLTAVDELDDELKLYIYSVITDGLKTKYEATSNYATENEGALKTSVDNMIEQQLKDKSIYTLFETLRKVSTLNGLAKLKLSEVNDLVNDNNIKSVVGSLNLSGKIKEYINKIPADRLPEDATVDIHFLTRTVSLSKEDLAKFKTEATGTGLATALANLAGKGPELKLNDFDVTDGVQVDVHYNSRAFTFYLWIDGLN